MNDRNLRGLIVIPDAPGRFAGHGPVSIIDIGSNSVRLVAYERMARSPTPLFNEKALCGLGRGLSETGRLDEDAIERALAAIHRFKTISDHLISVDLFVIATAAVREAENGADFIDQVAEITGTDPLVLSGSDEALYSARGVQSGIFEPDGVVGDLGGGSLELADLRGFEISETATHPLGGLRLQDEAGCDPLAAHKISLQDLKKSDILRAGRGRRFFAIGGTWRSLATLHMHQCGYPMEVLHHYTVPAKKMAAFCKMVYETPTDKLDQIDVVSKNRRPLLAYGAAVLSALIETMKPTDIVISALGIREGLLYGLLGEEERGLDGLLEGARELSVLRSRSPVNALEVVEWSNSYFQVLGIEEAPGEKRLREAACLLSDVGWRAHPDYRGAQALNTIAHAAFTCIDHPGRAFVALSAYFRHEGQVDNGSLPDLAQLLSSEMLLRARLLGLCFRIAHLLSASMPGLLEHSRFGRKNGTLYLTIDESQADSVGERLVRRLQQIGKLTGLETELRIGDFAD
ncbi:MAG: Ppx/GppA phosphatase family protein [Pseudomonadota bacterium]